MQILSGIWIFCHYLLCCTTLVWLEYVFKCMYTLFINENQIRIHVQLMERDIVIYPIIGISLT